jgi:hypothetical protein
MLSSKRRIRKESIARRTEFVAEIRDLKRVPGFSGGDRTDISLPAAQQQLLEALAATGKPLVVVLMNGSPLAVNWAQEHAAAILEAWYPGEKGSTATAETLLGTNNPAGRLPVTFYASLDQLPPFIGIFHAEPYLPLFWGQASLRLWLWIKVFDFRIQQLEAVVAAA